jgi:enamine deaminase RidA (YjgF/YER057c/UK114 family)
MDMAAGNGATAAFARLGLVLPPPPKPKGVYKPLVIVERMVLVSGHGPLLPDGTLLRGRVGRDLDEVAGKEAARQVGLAILATLVAGLGSLDRIGRVVKVLGMVNATPDFTRHPAVINGCSELFAAVWGPDRGGVRIGVRTARRCRPSSSPSPRRSSPWWRWSRHGACRRSSPSSWSRSGH